MVRYAAAGDADNGRAAVRELKQLVKDCHSNGLEVRRLPSLTSCHRTRLQTPPLAERPEDDGGLTGCGRHAAFHQHALGAPLL